MSFNNELPELLTNAGLTGLVVFLIYRIILKLIEKIPKCQ